MEGGVNFCVFSRNANAVELLLFDSRCDADPTRVIRLHAPAHRTYHYCDTVPKRALLRQVSAGHSAPPSRQMCNVRRLNAEPEAAEGLCE